VTYSLREYSEEEQWERRYRPGHRRRQENWKKTRRRRRPRSPTRCRGSSAASACASKTTCLITAAGREILTAGTPKTVDEVERACAETSRLPAPVETWGAPIWPLKPPNARGAPAEPRHPSITEETMKTLEGKIALVTGAGTGNRPRHRPHARRRGRAGRRRRAAARSRSSRSSRRSSVTRGRRPARRATLTKPHDARELGAWAVKTFGGVDILVNNAGHSSHARSIRWGRAGRVGRPCSA